MTRYIPATAICFPSDPWCPTYEKPNYDYDYSVEAGNETAGDGGDDYYGEDYYVEQAPVAPTVVEEPKMSDKTCELSSVPNVQYLPGLNGTATCTTINRCPNMVDNESAPQTHLIPCGFDEAEKLLMVCCPDEMVENPDDSLKQKPRFPKGSKRPRKCQDQSKLCRKWKTNGGCALDRDIIISEEDPWNGRVGSKVMFDFMQTACPQTCDLCGDKGCVDEHPRCQAWARAGYCVLAPFFMAHTCRYFVFVFVFVLCVLPFFIAHMFTEHCSGRAVACVGSFPRPTKRIRRKALTPIPTSPRAISIVEDSNHFVRSTGKTVML